MGGNGGGNCRPWPGYASIFSPSWTRTMAAWGEKVGCEAMQIKA